MNYLEKTLESYEQYVNPAMARLFRFMGLATIEETAEGIYITDNTGKKYIDCLGGYGSINLGHSNKEIVEACKQQMDKMPLSSKILINSKLAELCEKLAEITPEGLKYSFICNSGTEAVEGALKVAKIATGKPEIIATKGGFHGKSLGALSATGRELFRTPFEPLLPGFKHVPFGDIDAMKNAITENTAAIIIEIIQGEGGVILPPEGYIQNLRDLCTEKGVLLIVDEVQTGMARTGKMFASEHYNIKPDIMCLAKALGGGVMPIGAVIATEELWEKYIEAPLLHTSTFGGNPLACTAALKTIEIIQRDNLVEKTAEKGQYLLNRLTQLQEKYPTVIKEVRGKGLLIGIEFCKEGLGGMLMSEAIDKGLLVAYTLNNEKIFRIEPPLIITKEEIDEVISILDTCFGTVAMFAEDL
ncbi:acetylornithine/succinylornithine family transaminase [Alkalicella caledoniensis]|uniref:Acetylornithine/succinylornithine family transaminase n=1 Tax=Alkalicella caledoniensis TaxID=2731377 RepID=A0A7G9W460_ALKCA|nr:acetylornithine/succinylornithine family transaminase [Alkalicella caledoniensis]QNO13472.1 acetylornithine/succinylornithine family transaminase [Alkalicella caledoniensis]